MGLSHMAHNAVLGDHVIVVNGGLVGGYVEVADRAFISAYCLLHQFIRVGTLVMMRGGARASRDLPPYANIDNTHTVKGINLVGLRRAGFTAAQIAPLRQAFRLLFGRRTNLKQALEQVEAEVTLTPEVVHLLEFIRTSKRGVAMGPKQAQKEDEF
jgi:UDP-N-acetylglucosamine acyltransferase